MVTVFANNQALTCISGTPSAITTDPVAMNDNDRAAVNMNVHYVWATDGATTIAYQAQVSNDGVYWVDVSALTDSTTAATPTAPRQKVEAVNGAFLRFRITLSNSGAAGALGGTCMDLHVKLDHV